MRIMKRIFQWVMGAIVLASPAAISSARAQDVKPMPAAPVAPVAAPAPAPCTSAPCCLTSYCGSSCSSCDNGGGGGGGGIYADIGFMVLTPKFKDNPAYFVNITGTTPETFYQKDFYTHGQFVPMFSLGYSSACGFGVRLSWWGFSVSRTESASLGTDDDTIVAASPLQLQDLTGTTVGAQTGGER